MKNNKIIKVLSLVLVIIFMFTTMGQGIVSAYEGQEGTVGHGNFIIPNPRPNPKPNPNPNPNPSPNPNPPNAPLRAFISGPRTLMPYQSASYSVYVEGGMPPYTYRWSNRCTKPSASYVWHSKGNYTVTVTVTDSNKKTTKAQLNVKISNDNPVPIPPESPSSSFQMPDLQQLLKTWSPGKLYDLSNGFKGILVPSFDKKYYMYVFKPDTGKLMLYMYDSNNWVLLKVINTIKGFEKPMAVKNYKYSIWNDYSGNSNIKDDYTVDKKTSNSGDIVLYNPEQAKLTSNETVLKSSANDFYSEFCKYNSSLLPPPDVNIPTDNKYTLVPFVLQINNMTEPYQIVWQFNPDVKKIYYNSDKTAIWVVFNTKNIYTVTAKVIDSDGNTAIVSGQINIIIPDIKIRIGVPPIVYLYNKVSYSSQISDFTEETNGIYYPYDHTSPSYNGVIGFAVETPGTYRILEYSINGINIPKIFYNSRYYDFNINTNYTVKTSKSYILGIDGDNWEQYKKYGSGVFMLDIRYLAKYIGDKIPMNKDVVIKFKVINSDGKEKSVQAKTKITVAVPLLYGMGFYYTSTDVTTRTIKQYNVIVGSTSIDPKTGEGSIAYYSLALSSSKKYNSLDDIENDPDAMEQINKFYSDPEKYATKSAKTNCDFKTDNGLVADKKTRDKVMVDPIEDKRLDFWTDNLLQGANNLGGTFVTGGVEAVPIVSKTGVSYVPKYTTKTIRTEVPIYNRDFFGTYTIDSSASNFYKTGCHRYYTWNPYDITHKEYNIDSCKIFSDVPKVIVTSKEDLLRVQVKNSHLLENYIDYIILKPDTSFTISFPVSIVYKYKHKYRKFYIDISKMKPGYGFDNMTIEDNKVKLHYTARGILDALYRNNNKVITLKDVYDYILKKWRVYLPSLSFFNYDIAHYSNEPPYVIGTIVKPSKFIFNDDKPQYGKLMYLLSDGSYVSYDSNESGYIYSSDDADLKIGYYTIYKDLLTILPIHKGIGTLTLDKHGHKIHVTNNIETEDSFTISLNNYQYKIGSSYLSQHFKSGDVTGIGYVVKSEAVWWPWFHWKYKTGLDENYSGYTWSNLYDSVSEATSHVPVKKININIKRKDSTAPYIRVTIYYKCGDKKIKQIINTEGVTVFDPSDFVRDILSKVNIWNSYTATAGYSIEISFDKTNWILIDNSETVIDFDIL